MKLGYIWADYNDPYSPKKPLLGLDASLSAQGADTLYTTKKAAIAEIKLYLEDHDCGDWKPKIKLRKITASKVIW